MRERPIIFPETEPERMERRVVELLSDFGEAHDVHVPCKRQLARHLVQNMPPKPPVRVVLTVWDWIDPVQPASVYNTEHGVAYSMGDLHSGTVFRAAVELSDEDVDTIRAAAAKGHQPLFRLMLEDDYDA